MRDGFTAERAGFRHRAIFLVLAVALVASAGLGFAHASLPLAELPGFFPATAAAIILCDLMTGYLIIVHAPLAGRWSLLWLGGAYLFSAVMVLSHLLMFPGMWGAGSPFNVSPQAVPWIWGLWHGGFSLFVVVSMLVLMGEQKRKRPGGIGRWQIAVVFVSVLVVAAICLAMATADPSPLPPVIEGDRFHYPLSILPGATIYLLNFLALFLIIAVTRCRSILDLGLLIAVFASLIDVVMSMQSGARYSLGWYGGRIISLVPAISVLIVYLREVTLLYARVTRLNERLEEQLSLDVTTGLFNRRHFNLKFEAAVAEAQRRRERLSLLLIDVDHFKLYNDHYGHLAGDECLKRVAEAIRSALRGPSDLAARFGGEEFAVILPSTDAAGAMLAAERILEAVAHRALEHRGSPTAATVTVSIGVASGEVGRSLGEVVRQADLALYQAKQKGRNRLVRHRALEPA